MAVSQTGGFKIFTKLRFQQNGSYVDGDESQPISFIDGQQLASLKKTLSYFTRHEDKLPYWYDDDKTKFRLLLKRIDG